MAWQRSGDTGATYPKLMAVRGDARADDRTINEIAGFVWRLSMQSGAHTTDYVLDVGTVEMLGGSRTTELLRLAVKHRLLTKVRTDHGAGYKLIEDPDFIHLRSKAEVEWERQQRNDTRNVSLLIPVLLRDGDSCRWCGIGVVWLGRKTARSGEWDHLVPGQPGTVETMVVACVGCNRARGGDVERWDSAHTLRPAPQRPRYGEATAKKLTDNGYPTTPVDDEVRLALAPGADTAPKRVRSATATSDNTAPAPGRAQEVPQEVPRNAVPRSVRTTPAGSGRVGPDLGLGRSTAIDLALSDPPARRRGRRGGRRNPNRGDT